MGQWDFRELKDGEGNLMDIEGQVRQIIDILLSDIYLNLGPDFELPCKVLECLNL